jgi:feruloyl esterase
MRPLVCCLLLGLLCRPAWVIAQATDPGPCAALSALSFNAAVGADVTLAAVEAVAADKDLPAYCRVAGNIAPEVEFLIWLPVTDWNRGLLVAGCGGLCGLIMKPGMEDALIRGYATATTNMGHSNDVYPDTRWAYNNPQLETDFAHRATHVTTVLAKEIIRAFYGQTAARAYFRGCSTGGRQGLVAAQRYPHDYHGIIVGAPFDQATSVPQFFWAVQSNTGPDGKPILGAGQFNLLHAAAMDACDEEDGLADGIVSDPQACHFDPAAVQCASDTSRDCLTAVQVTAARNIYQGPRTSDGDQLYPSGPAPGSEFTWAKQLLGKDGGPSFFYSVAQNWSQYLAYEPDPPLDSGPFAFAFDSGPQRMAASVELTGFAPELKSYADSGGKLLMYHGWVDESFPGAHSINYWQQAQARAGGRDQVGDYYRLFMMPGMTHCGAGPGASEVDYLTALERWVERGEAPEQLTAFKREKSVPVFVRQPRFPLPEAEIVFARPVYPYPDVTHYAGTGDPADAESFIRVHRGE